MSKDPESLGKGVGALLADLVPLLPSGARRAGAAKVMAARIGHDPSVLVNHPLKTQLLALGIGGVGNALTQGSGRPARAAATLGPIALVQLLRRRELEKIQEKYDKEKRKRLAEVDQEKLFDNGVLGWGGSSRLGAVNAYETMRARKYKGFGSLAEAGDAIQLAAGAVNPALYTGAIPFISGIDNREADRMLKSADFSDQRNSPSLPLYLAAAALSSAGMGAAYRWAHKENANTPALGTNKWADMVQDMGGGNPLLLSTEGVGNAFFYKPRSPQEAEQFLRETGHLSQAPMGMITATNNANRKRLERFGAIIADSTAGAPTIAHEAGHAKIEETPGVLRALQRHLYPHTRWMAPLAGAGSMAAGLASGGAGKGALLGTGIGALAGIGMLGPETGASYYALKHLKGLGDGSMSAEGRKDLISALSTYLAATVLPSTLSGAAGGWISGRRKKREEEEGQEKAAAVLQANDPDMEILSVGTPLERVLYHVTSKKLEALDPAFNRKRHYGYEYGVPVVFAGDSVSSAFAATPTDTYTALQEKLKDSIYHRLIDEKTGRKLLLGHNRGGFVHELDSKHFHKVHRRDKEVGKHSDSVEYVSTQKVRPTKVYPVKDYDVESIPEYEYLGAENVGEMTVEDYLSKAKDPTVIKAVQEWQAKAASATPLPKAVIIKGNPYYVTDNPKADAFYEELAQLVRDQGYEPSFDPGEPHTLPDESAALWLAHSRGGSRLRFAPEGVKTLRVDPFEEGYEDRQRDSAAQMAAAGFSSMADWPKETRPVPPDEHYQVTDALREAIKGLAAQGQEKAAADEMTHSHTKTMPDGSKLDIVKLIELLRDRQAEARHLDDLRGPGRSSRTGFSAKRYAAADTAHPLIVDEANQVLDGRHRYFKLRDAGESDAQVRVATPEDVHASTLQEKSAAFDPNFAWRIIDRARKIGGALGPEARDGHTMEHLGAVYSAAVKQFFGNPQVKEMGLSSRTPRAKVVEALKGFKAAILPAPPTIPPPPSGPLVQDTFDFFKDAQAKWQEKAANARLRAMLKLRRATQVINPDDVITDAGEAIQTSGAFLPSAASPTGKPLLLFAPGVRRSTKKHELTHLYQSELPSLQQTPGEFFSKIMHRGLDMRAPMELGALLRERKGMPLIDNLKQFNYTAGNWQRRYGGDKSFSPFVWANRKLGWIPDFYKSAATQPAGLTRDDIVKILGEYGHPSMTMGAGTAMTLRGLRDSTADIDATAPLDVFNELRARYDNPELSEYAGAQLFNIPGTPIDLHYDPESEDGEVMEGVNGKVRTPEQLLTFYRKLGRDKDQQWIKKLEEGSNQHPALPGLLQAKEYSDKKDYRQKSLLLRQMMEEAPDDWLIDSDDGKGIVGVTHTPTGFKLHVRKDRVTPAVVSTLNTMFKSSNDTTVRDILIGAGLGGSLPAASHARYELLERPAFRKQILDLVAKAQAEKKLFAAPLSAGHRDWANPLQKKMRIGDTILQSHTGDSLLDMLKSRRVDLTTLSLGGSGGAFPHAAVSDAGGRAIDPGKDGVKTFKQGLVDLLRRPHKITLDRLKELKELQKIHPSGMSASKYLASVGVDAFDPGDGFPNASVVTRPDNVSGVSPARVQQHLADVKSVGYSKPDAGAAGLKRLALPTRPSYKQRSISDLLQGTFCSHGACSTQAMHGIKTPKLQDALPSDLLNSKGQSLVGIGVNRPALDALSGSGLRGQDRLAEAARRTMLDTLRQGASTRRVFAGALGTTMAGAGALGGLLGNKIVERVTRDKE